LRKERNESVYVREETGEKRRRTGVGRVVRELSGNGRRRRLLGSGTRRRDPVDVAVDVEARSAAALLGRVVVASPQALVGVLLGGGLEDLVRAPCRIQTGSVTNNEEEREKEATNSILRRR
jgi:hypothetical protein